MQYGEIKAIENRFTIVSLIMVLHGISINQDFPRLSPSPCFFARRKAREIFIFKNRAEPQIIYQFARVREPVRHLKERANALLEGNKY